MGRLCADVFIVPLYRVHCGSNHLSLVLTLSLTVLGYSNLWLLVQISQGNIKLNYDLNLTTACITVIRPR